MACTENSWWTLHCKTYMVEKNGPGERDFSKIKNCKSNSLTIFAWFKNLIKVFNWLNGIHPELDGYEKNWSVLIYFWLNCFIHKHRAKKKASGSKQQSEIAGFMPPSPSIYTHLYNITNKPIYWVLTVFKSTCTATASSYCLYKPS